MAEREELKSLLMKAKEESGKVDLNLNIQKTKIMAFAHGTMAKQIRRELHQAYSPHLAISRKHRGKGNMLNGTKRK